MQELFFNKKCFSKADERQQLSQAGFSPEKWVLVGQCICRYMNGSRKKPSPKVIEGFIKAFPNHSITYYFFYPGGEVL